MDNAQFVPLRVYYGGEGAGEGLEAGWGDFIRTPVDGVVTELPKRKSAPRESFVAAIHRHCSAPGVIRIGDTSPFELTTFTKL